MTDVSVAAASGALAGGGAAAITGWPPQEVIFWALMGGLVSVWLSRKADAAITLPWAVGSFVQIFVSALSGVALSALALAIAPSYSWLAPVVAVPRWVMAAVIAALIFKLGPLAWGWMQRRAGGKEGGTPNA